MHGMAYKYREDLPTNCPPSGAGALGSQVVLRLITGKTACDEDFKSHAALGKKCHGHASPCTAAACSVFAESTSQHGVTDLAKLPKLRDRRFVARLNVDASSGLAEMSSHGNHISIWMFKSFDPVKAVVSVAPLP
jgi:hypothetical protein